MTVHPKLSTGFLALGVVLSLLTMGRTAPAQALDTASTQALSQTQDLLNSPEQRNAFIQKDEKAKAAEDKLQATGLNAADQQKAYELSSQIMASLAQKTSGDVAKQKELMEQAARDPQAFLNDLPADQRKQIEDMAARTEAAKTVPAAR